MMRYDGWYLFSDVDGTLMTGQYTIPQRNLDALANFTAQGGHFALATGRGLLHTRTLAEQLWVNAPCILLNGGLLYDYQAQKALFVSYLPDASREMLFEILRERPELRVMIWVYDDRYDVGARVNLPPDPHFADARDLTEPWSKLVVHVPCEERQDFIRRLEQMNVPGVRITASSDWFVEVLPEGVSKGMGVELLIDRLSISRDRIAVVGDYLNDLELLRVPDVRHFCPENAHADIKALCERPLCHVDDGALADLIARL